MFDELQNLQLKLKNIPINVEMINILQKADIEYSKDVGDIPNIASCVVGKTEINIDFTFPYIMDFYSMYQYLDWIEIGKYEELPILEWLDRVCVEYLSKYDIPENVICIEIKYLSWITENYELYDPKDNPFKVERQYKFIVRDALFFILRKMNISYVDIDEIMVLEIWKNIKSLNKLYIF